MSMIFPEYDATFIHIPKCGGSFIENILKKITKGSNPIKTESVGRHATHFQILNKTKKIFSQVREPVSWYLSYFRYCKGKPKVWEPHVWHPTDILAKCDWTDFNKWIFSIQKIRPSYLTRMYESFIGDERMITNIKTFRLEDMPESLNNIFLYLNINKKIPKINEADYNKSLFELPEINKETINLIKEREINLYERFYKEKL